jgi:hypothetical protein
LVSACEKAKRGELDARGFGALDPWRMQLKAECVPRPEIHLVQPDEWMSQQKSDSVNLTILSSDASSAPFKVGYSEYMASLKDTIFQALKPDFSRSRMKLSHPIYGSLRDDRTPAYYNLKDGDCLELKLKMRGGRKVNRQL